MINQGKLANAPFQYPAPANCPRMIRHQEQKWFYELSNVRRTFLNGIQAHPSVSRLIPTDENSHVIPPLKVMQRAGAANVDVSPYRYYLDSVQPGHDEYRVGDGKF